MGIFVFIVWIVFSIMVTAVASAKGRSGCAWFFISLIISPLLAIIVIACLGDSKEKKEEEIKQFVKISEDVKNSNNEASHVEKPSVTDQLVKLAEMKEKGLLTDAEYEEAKKKIFIS